MEVINVFDGEMEEGPGRQGFWFPAAKLGPRLRAARIGAGFYEARDGVPIWPYRYEYGRELWLLALGGALTVRHAEGERALPPGDLACFACGRPEEVQPRRR